MIFWIFCGLLRIYEHYYIGSFEIKYYIFYTVEKSASAGAGAGVIIKIWRAVRKCVQNNHKGATVRAPHSKNPRNPTSVKV